MGTFFCWLHTHGQMGMGRIRKCFEFWRPILDLGNEKLTTNMIRKTFCTLGAKYTGTGNEHPGALQDPRPAAHGRHPPQEP